MTEEGRNEECMREEDKRKEDMSTNPNMLMRKHWTL
jgi:hypothetical protein